MQRCRRLLDLDADPVAVDEVLGADPLLAPARARARPAAACPGAVDGAELAVRAVLGQQVSVAGARTLAGPADGARSARRCPQPDGGLTHAFPTAEALAAADPTALPLTRARASARSPRSAARSPAATLTLDPGADRAATRERLLALPGIGPWTVEYVAMRALGDPDAFPATDLGVRNAPSSSSAMPGDGPAATALAERWRPWRAYAVQHLWASLY